MLQPYSEINKLNCLWDHFNNRKSEASLKNGRRIKNFQNILKQLERAADSEETKAKRGK